MAVPGLPDHPTPGRPLGKGGQAIVYEVLGEPNYILKVYNEAVSPQDCRRIDRIIALANQKTLHGAALPRKRREWQGKVALLLPRIYHAEPIHTLFERQSWITFIPDMDWRFVVRVAAQAALACARVHDAGLVAVDISDNNILVTRAGEVTLIDCDSFVLEGAGQDGMSPVASPGWLPPELLGKSLGQIPRTANHDNFALARLIFKLLMKGSDPMGPPLGRDADSTRERVFAFSQKMPHRQPAPFELTLAALPRELADLFEKAFAPPNAGRINRPKAAEWALALGAMTLELRQCSVAPRHVYVPLPGASCPWCVLAARNVAFDPYHGGVTARPGPVPPQAQPNVGPSPSAAFGAPQQSPWSGSPIFAALKHVSSFFLSTAGLLLGGFALAVLGLLKLAGRMLLNAWRPVLTVGVLLTVASTLYFKILPENLIKPGFRSDTVDAVGVHSKIRNFIEKYFVDFSSNSAPQQALDQAFADHVCYMSHIVTKTESVDDQMNIVKKFPARLYQPQLDNMIINCSEENTICQVSVNVDYRAKTQWRAWKYLFVLNVSNDGIKITTFGGCSASGSCNLADASCPAEH